MNQPTEGKPGRYWHIVEDGRIQCDVCPRYCKAAIIVVTHDEMILDRFDHIFRLRDGRLEKETAIGLKPESATVS